MSRFSTLAPRSFIPFWMLGDPNLEACIEVIQTLVDNGADALELGIPFSDPVADGPVLQRAGMRAFAAGVTPSKCFELLASIRERYPEIPISLLTYANIAVAQGLENFYHSCALAGVDAVLLADVSTLEAEPFCLAAAQAGIDPVLIVPPNATEEQLKAIARYSKGYVYGVTRPGVTGVDDELSLKAQHVIQRLQELGAPPVLMGFGISKPEHVRAALTQGAAGAISGSAVVQTALDKPGQLGAFIRVMKAATACS